MVCGQPSPVSVVCRRGLEDRDRPVITIRRRSSSLKQIHQEHPSGRDGHDRQGCSKDEIMRAPDGVFEQLGRHHTPEEVQDPPHCGGVKTRQVS